MRTITGALAPGIRLGGELRRMQSGRGERDGENSADEGFVSLDELHEGGLHIAPGDRFEASEAPPLG